MNIGATPAGLPAQMATSALKGALETQSNLATKLLESGAQMQSGGAYAQSAMAEAGKGTQLNSVC